MPDPPSGRILNVDDNEAERYTTTKVLKNAGFEVIEAANGTDALTLAAEKHPDLVFLDVNLPDISGFEVCKQLKADKNTASILVVHQSATFVKPPEQVQGLEGGADGYLVHPIEPDVLVATIRSFLRIRNAERALRESEERYRRLFETAQDGIIILDEETGKIIDANAFILDLLGYPLKDFVGRYLWELGFAREKSFARNAFLKLKTDGYIRYEDLPLETKDGQSIDVEFISNVYLVGEKKIIQCNIRNITDRKRAEDALSLAHRKLTLLSGITRHDIRNQILVLSANLEFSKEFLGDPARTAEYIAKEEKIVENIGHQITFTKYYEDLGVKASEWQNVNTVIKKVITGLPMREVSVDFGNPALEVFADPLLEKVFYNLFDNAVRYGGEQMRVIQVTNRQDNGRLVIAVEDDGNGISAEDKKQLFTKGFGKNTGLGLFLTREILSITGITITETGKPGKGARFEIVVPEGMFRFTGQADDKTAGGANRHD